MIKTNDNKGESIRNTQRNHTWSASQILQRSVSFFTWFLSVFFFYKKKSSSSPPPNQPTHQIFFFSHFSPFFPSSFLLVFFLIFSPQIDPLPLPPGTSLHLLFAPCSANMSLSQPPRPCMLDSSENRPPLSNEKHISPPGVRKKRWSKRVYNCLFGIFWR